MNKDSYFIHDTRIRFNNNTDLRQGRYERRPRYKHYALLHRVLNMLRDEGFTIENDPGVDKIIRKNYFRGRRGDLEIKAHRFPAGFEMEFFQNVIFENQYGGEYDFDKLQKMPYLIRLQYEKYMNLIIRKMKSLVELEDTSRIKTKTAEDWIKARYVESCHYPQTDMNFDLHALDGQEHKGQYGLDRDGKEIHNGEIKYFRYFGDGRLYRGRVYYDLNMNWIVILNKKDVKVVPCWELFDLSPEDYRGRQKVAKIPKEYQERRKAIEATKTKELLNELRRRGVKIPC